VVSWGASDFGGVPAPLTNVVSIAGGWEHSLAIVGKDPLGPFGPVVITVQPFNQRVVPGDTVRLHVMALGNSPLDYQWQFNGANIVGATSSTLILSNFQSVNSGDYLVIVSNASGSEASRAAKVRVINRPPVARASAKPVIVAPAILTVPIVVASSKSGATVILDGSLSSDPDNDPLQYFWSEQGLTDPIPSGVLVTRWLPLGKHTIVLSVSDGIDTRSDQLTLEVVTPGQAVAGLLLPTVESAIDEKNRQPLLAVLNAAQASFERGNFGAAVNQLEAFENKVRAQIQAADQSLADVLLDTAQKILNAVTATGR